VGCRDLAPSSVGLAPIKASGVHEIDTNLSLFWVEGPLENSIALWS